MRRILGTLLVMVSLIVGALSARADSVEDFYKGRLIRFISGYPAGTDYDFWARLIARHWGDFIPGHPTFVVEFMPGGGQIVAANYLYNVAEHDGATVLMFERSLPYYALLGDKNIHFDPAKFNWIGSAEQTNRACFAIDGAPVQKAADLFDKELIVGGAGVASGLSNTPLLLSKLLGMKFKLIEGYSGAENVLLSIEKGELQGLCDSVSGLRAVRPGWIEQGKLKVLFTMLHDPEPGLNVPTIYEFTKTDEQRQIINLYMTSLEFGRPIIAPPGIPAERVTALRRGFDAMVADPSFQADAEKLHYTLTLRKGEVLQDIATRLMATPKEVVDRVQSLTK
ncbi:MAG TPA: hypothetical protein VG271_19500 [Beijerinckiaceae bacterium]|nr:hypothetical protein [Beijerinckiaceae bacterium]